MGKREVKRARKKRQRTRQNERAQPAVLINRVGMIPLQGLRTFGLDPGVIDTAGSFRLDGLLRPAAKMDADMVEAMALMNTAREEGVEIGAATWKRYDDALARARQADRVRIKEMVTKATTPLGEAKAGLDKLANAMNIAAGGMKQFGAAAGALVPDEVFHSMLSTGILTIDEARGMYAQNPIQSVSRPDGNREAARSAKIHFIIAPDIKVARHVCETDWQLRRANFGGRGFERGTWVTPHHDLIKYAEDERSFHGGPRDAIVFVGPGVDQDGRSRRLFEYAIATGLTTVLHSNPCVREILDEGEYIPF